MDARRKERSDRTYDDITSTVSIERQPSPPPLVHVDSMLRQRPTALQSVCVHNLSRDVLTKILAYVPWHLARRVCRRWALCRPMPGVAVLQADATRVLARAAHMCAAYEEICSISPPQESPDWYANALVTLAETYSSRSLCNATGLRALLAKVDVVVVNDHGQCKIGRDINSRADYSMTSYSNAGCVFATPAGMQSEMDCEKLLTLVRLSGGPTFFGKQYMDEIMHYLPIWFDEHTPNPEVLRQYSALVGWTIVE